MQQSRSGHNNSFFSESTENLAGNNNILSLAGTKSANIDLMLAQANIKKHGEPDRFASLLNKKSNELIKKQRKPKNVTPAPPRPYCRYGYFKKLPQYSLNAVSRWFPFLLLTFANCGF